MRQTINNRNNKTKNTTKTVEIMSMSIDRIIVTADVEVTPGLDYWDKHISKFALTDGIFVYAKGRVSNLRR